MDFENRNIHAPAHSTSGYKILPNASQHKELYVAEMAAVMSPTAPLQCDARCSGTGRLPLYKKQNDRRMSTNVDCANVDHEANTLEAKAVRRKVRADET